MALFKIPVFLTDNAFTRTIFSSFLIKRIWYFIAPFFFKVDVIHPPENIRSISWGRRASQVNARLPKIIWSYWEGPFSYCGHACQASWAQNSEGFLIRILDDKSVRQYLDDFPDIPSDVPIQLKSDLIRLLLLERYGGIWLDYSIVLTRPISWIFDGLEETHSDVFAFYNEAPGEYRKNYERPIIENGLIAARQGCEFISVWRKFHQDCITSGQWKGYYRSFQSYFDLISNFLTKDESLIDYLACYISAQRAMLQQPAGKLYLVNAQDEYYFCRYALPRQLRSIRLAHLLLLVPLKKGAQTSAVIKLTRGNRVFLDEYIKYCCFRKDAILGKYVDIKK